ncbi:MAG TPA: outer membrane beta-barrel protein [Puia sp.]|nr:outer membrane beta-barrel protein [Puia sp.]
MRPILKYGAVTAIILMICSQTRAQNALQMSIGYNVNIPSGDFRNLVTNPAYKGFTAGLAYPLNDRFSLGLSFGYNDYYQKYPRQVYDDGKGSNISAVVSNSIQQIPLQITANYTLLNKGFIRPYIGGGAGVNFISFDQYLGEFDNPESSTRLSLTGEAGFFIPLSRYSSTALKIGASYNYVPYHENGIANLDTWGIHAGIRFPLH